MCTDEDIEDDCEIPEKVYWKRPYEIEVQTRIGDWGFDSSQEKLDNRCEGNLDFPFTRIRLSK